MRPRRLAWRRLLPVWVPALLFLLANVVGYVWQTSSTLGRQARISGQVSELEAKLERLESVASTASGQREQVDLLEGELAHLYHDVFGDLEQRLTPIMRAVGDATRSAGLSPDSFRYDAEAEDDLGVTRFGVSFSVEGEYSQVRRMLAELQASPQLLMVDRISFVGEPGTATRALRITVHVTTYVASAEGDLLRRLVREGEQG